MAAREVLGATGGFPVPAVELEAPGLVAAPFFTIFMAAAIAARLQLVEDSRAQGRRTNEDEQCGGKEENLAAVLSL